MISKTLHITNGDTTSDYIKELGIPGAIITWREMLCEGRTVAKVGTEDFWKTRFHFLNSAYQISKKLFIEKTLKEYRSLCNQKNDAEIILWFEHDLFCQINMIAVISWLKKNKKGQPIFLVSSGDVSGHKERLGLGELSSEEFLNHYKNRIQLSQEDIDYADYIWQLYCSNSPLRLETVVKLGSKTSFTYLQEAIETHIRRFPSTANGLNNIENYVLQVANSLSLSSTEQLIHSLLKTEKKYGYGDVQFQHEVLKLSPLFSSFNPITVNAQGKNLLANKANYYSQLNDKNTYLGGVKKYSYLFDNQNHKLIKIAS